MQGPRESADYGQEQPAHPEIEGNRYALERVITGALQRDTGCRERPNRATE